MKTSPGLGTRTVDRLFQRVRRLPPARNDYVVERGLRTPTRDGVVLVGDHYVPAVATAGGATILIRTPYGRGLPVDVLYARTFAARGYHVIVQSCLGTQDSTGTFEPFVHEDDDGRERVADDHHGTCLPVVGGTDRAIGISQSARCHVPLKPGRPVLLVSTGRKTDLSQT